MASPGFCERLGCSFPPDEKVEERLVVVDVMDRAIYIGDPLLDEWQEFSERMSVPETTVHDSGLQVECACIENGIQEVIFHFSSVANVSCFLEALQKAGHQGLHSNVAALHLHRMEERRKPNNRSGVRELLHKSLSQNAQSAPLESAAETVQPLPTTDEASSQREHPKPANGLPKLDPAAVLPVALSSVAELRPDKKLVPAPSLKLALAGVPIVSPTPQDETGRRGSKLDIRPMHGTEEEKHYADIVQEYTSAERGQETGLELRLSLSAAMQQKFQATVAKAGKIGKASNGDTRRHSTRARFQRTSSDEKDKTKSEPGNLDDTIRLLAAESAADLCSDFKLVVVQSTSTIGAVLDVFRDQEFVLFARSSDPRQDSVIAKDSFMGALLLTGVHEDITMLEWEERFLPRHGVDRLPNLESCYDETPLTEVMSKMVATRSQYLAVRDEQGVIFGVLRKADLMIQLAADVERHQAKNRKQLGAGAHSVKKPLRFQMNPDPYESMGSSQKITAKWVSSGVTEGTIFLLLFVDIATTIFDMAMYSTCIRCEEEWSTDVTSANPFYKLSELDTETPFLSAENCINRMFLYDCNTSASFKNPLNVISLVILSIFTMECMLRLYSWRLNMFTNWLDVADFLVLLFYPSITLKSEMIKRQYRINKVVVASIVTFFVLALVGGDPQIRSLLVFGRVIRLLRIIRIYRRLVKMAQSRKIRYQKFGFNLDLSYITNQVIAMALPATGMESKFRNPLEEVQRFMRTMHQDHTGPKYLIFNLASERAYSAKLFDDQVETYPTDDHCPIMMEVLCEAIVTMEGFLAEHPRHIVAVHCKNGKGRTAQLIVSWLLYSGFSKATKFSSLPQVDALQWFSLKRTGKRDSVEVACEDPSQLRYIEYFHKVCQEGGYTAPSIALHKITLHTTPKMDRNKGCDPWFVIEMRGREVFDYSKEHVVQRMHAGREKIEFDANNTVVQGDVCITFYHHSEEPVSDEKMFYLWFHTGFIENNRLILTKSELDGCSRDEKNKVFAAGVKLELEFKSVKHARIPRYSMKSASRATSDVAQSMSVRMRMEVEDEERLARRALSWAPHAGIITKRMRKLVSGEKRRFQADGFDLDLTYITKRVIALGFPAQGGEGLFRNRAEEVSRFFDLRHPNHYRIYNLCVERDHDVGTLFAEKAQVRNSFGFHDHNPPPLDLMGAFCKDVEAFLAADPQNVVGVHCLAGKGRSGVMVCAYLLHSRLFSTALQARGYFDEMRMRNGKGVTVPSQVQYVGYYERVLQYQRDGYVVPLGRNALTIEILSLELRDFVPRDIAALEAAEIHVEISYIDPDSLAPREKPRQASYKSWEKGCSLQQHAGSLMLKFPTETPLYVKGDVRLRVVQVNGINIDDYFALWFHTTMLGHNFESTVDSQVWGVREVDAPRHNPKRSAGADSSWTFAVRFKRTRLHPFAEPPPASQADGPLQPLLENTTPDPSSVLSQPTAMIGSVSTCPPQVDVEVKQIGDDIV